MGTLIRTLPCSPKRRHPVPTLPRSDRHPDHTLPPSRRHPDPELVEGEGPLYLSFLSLLSFLQCAPSSSASCKRVGSTSSGDKTHSQSGLTLIELIICVAIVSVLASAAIPIARFQVKREKERELRRDLWEMRDAIDHYKDAADKGAMQIKADSLGYPPDLETLVNGVDIQDKKVKFLRRIPVDPMTGTTDWGLRSNQDDADSDSFGGQNVFDVHSKSQGTGLDGTKYSTW
jgi:general secretion pathway protein G